MGHQLTETFSSSSFQVYRTVYDPQHVCVSNHVLPYCPVVPEADTYTFALTLHTVWVQGLRNQHSKSQQKSFVPVSALFWRCWPGEKVKSSIQNPLLANRRASCLVPAPLWFVFDRSVSNQIAIGQPIKKKKVATKRFILAAENLSRHVGNMSMTSWQPTVFLKWRANKSRIFIMQALSSNSARSLTNTAASKN